MHDAGVLSGSRRTAPGFAVACGVLPLSVGVAIFGSWPATRRDAWMIAGHSFLFVGTGIVGTGIVALGRACRRRRP